MLAAAGAPVVPGLQGAAPGPATSIAWTCAQVRRAIHRGRLHHPLVTFVVLPLLLAVPAFRLHPHIAFGSSFGEYEAFGLVAHLSAFGVWWAAWAIAAVRVAAALRAAIEAGALASVVLRAPRAVGVRRGLERVGLVALYLGLPAWLAMRVYGP